MVSKDFSVHVNADKFYMLSYFVVQFANCRIKRIDLLKHPVILLIILSHLRVFSLYISMISLHRRMQLCYDTKVAFHFY